jgi:dTDP-4-amino-4,6-dideoxygalactose transaminase
VDGAVLGVDRDGLVKALWKRNIGTSVHFIPLHLQPFYRKRYGYRTGDFPVAERIFQGILSLPLFPRMTVRDVDDVVAAIREVIP